MGQQIFYVRPGRWKGSSICTWFKLWKVRARHPTRSHIVAYLLACLVGVGQQPGPQYLGASHILNLDQGRFQRVSVGSSSPSPLPTSRPFLLSGCLSCQLQVHAEAKSITWHQFPPVHQGTQFHVVKSPSQIPPPSGSVSQIEP